MTQGKYTWKNGDVYEGTYITVDNVCFKRNGKYTWADTTFYEGYFIVEWRGYSYYGQEKVWTFGFNKGALSMSVTKQNNLTPTEKLIACGLFVSGTTVEEAESQFKVIEQAAKDINEAYTHFLDIVHKSNNNRSSFNNEKEWEQNLEESKNTFLTTLTKKRLTKETLNEALITLSDTKKNIPDAAVKAETSEYKKLSLYHQQIIDKVMFYGDIEASAVGSSIFDSIDVYKKFLPYKLYVYKSERPD